MKKLLALLMAACAAASAQDVLLTGHVQRVILQPSGSPGCPPVCPAPGARNADGTTRVCISNDGGCQTMELEVDQVYRGDAGGATRRFNARIGEFGSDFPVTTRQVIVSQEGGAVSWSETTERDGMMYIDPPHRRHVGGVLAAIAGSDAQLPLGEALKRWDAGH